MRQKHYTEAEALQALLQGREEGLDYFFHQYYTPLTYFAFKLLGDQSPAEEIASEAFVKLWNYREHLCAEGSIKAWLYRIVRNGCVDHLRMVKRLEVHKHGLQYTHERVEQSVLQHLIAAETLQQILRTLEVLPPKCSQVFQMFYLQGKNQEEIAKELGLSPHTVRNQKIRAVRLIKEHLGSLLVLWLLVHPL